MIIPLSIVLGVVPLVLGLTTEEVLTGYGPLGVIAIGAGWLVRRVLDSSDTREAQYRDDLAATEARWRDEFNRVKDQRDQMIADLLTQVIPTITRATETLERRQELDVRQQDLHARLTTALERLERRLDRDLT